METTIDDVKKAAINKGYKPLFPESTWEKAIAAGVDKPQYIEISAIMIWLHVKHKSPLADITVIKHRMDVDREAVLSEIHQKILALN